MKLSPAPLKVRVVVAVVLVGVTALGFLNKSQPVARAAMINTIITMFLLVFRGIF
jgi:hypothetical protein